MASARCHNASLLCGLGRLFGLLCVFEVVVPGLRCGAVLALPVAGLAVDLVLAGFGCATPGLCFREAEVVFDFVLLFCAPAGMADAMNARRRSGVKPVTNRRRVFMG